MSMSVVESGVEFSTRMKIPLGRQADHSPLRWMGLAATQVLLAQGEFRY